MAKAPKFITVFLLLTLCALTWAQQQKPFPIVSTVDEPTIAGRPVQLDASGKLLPWPMPDNIGYSYSSARPDSSGPFSGTNTTASACTISTAASISIARPTNSSPTRSGPTPPDIFAPCCEGFIERLYPYTGDARMLTFLEDFIDYELEYGTHSRRLRLVSRPLCLSRSRRAALYGLERARQGLHRAPRSRRRRLRLSALI